MEEFFGVLVEAGSSGPGSGVVVSWDRARRFRLFSDRVPGAVQWWADDEDDGTVEEGEAGAVRFVTDGRHVPVQAPAWSVEVATPAGPMPLLVMAAEAQADLVLADGVVVGTVRMRGRSADGVVRGFEARILPHGQGIPVAPGWEPDRALPGEEWRERAALRARAEALVNRGLYREAVPVLEEAVAAYRVAVEEAEDPTHDLLALVFLVSCQMSCALSGPLGPANATLVRHLRDFAEVRRRLEGPAVVGAAWERTRSEALMWLGLDHDVLAAAAGRAPNLRAPLGRALDVLRKAAEALAAAAGPGGHRRGGEVFAEVSGELRLIAEEVLALDEGAVPEEVRQVRLGLLVFDEQAEERERAWLAALPGVPGDTGLARLVTETAVLLVGAAERQRLLRERLARLDLGAAEARWREQNAAALLGSVQLLDQWRRRLEHDWERIAMLDHSEPALAELVTALYDFGAVEQALAMAEAGRARALADLLARDRAHAPRLSPARLHEVLLGRAVVEYFLAGERLLVFAVRPDGGIVTADVRIDRAALDADLRRLDALMDPAVKIPEDLPELAEVLRRLGAMLWDPVPWLPERGEPVLVVPHGALLPVPFAALVTASGERVAAGHPTSVLPAAALVGELVWPRPAASGMLALVSPARMPAPGMLPLPLLEEAFASDVAALLPGPPRVYVGAEATRDRLAEVAAEPPQMLCFATHCEAFSDEPMDSYLALEGERLTAAEVMELDLPASVVALAACRTGTGKVSADGVVGLARAFLIAGAGCVLTTLWRTSERETLRVLRQFTYYLSEGMAPAEALRMAHLRLDRGDPRGWASFVLFGSPN